MRSINVKVSGYVGENFFPKNIFLHISIYYDVIFHIPLKKFTRMFYFSKKIAKRPDRDFKSTGNALSTALEKHKFSIF